MLFRVVFFFKQKTAYEMRISDWSSDVCSSDLLRQPGRQPVNADARSVPSIDIGEGGIHAGTIQVLLGIIGMGQDAAIVHHQRDAVRDRKSVVKGKCVSVRVDLGVSRITKQKTDNRYVYTLVNDYKTNNT